MDRMTVSMSGGQSAHLSFEDRRASSSNNKSTALESRVEELLASMSMYISPSFQPLTRALEILSSPRAEEELARLRSDWQEVDALVDHVVALHHVEFTTALQEYSRLVTLLREVHLCMNEVRRCLSVAMDGVRVEEEGLARVTKDYAEGGPRDLASISDESRPTNARRIGSSSSRWIKPHWKYITMGEKRWGEGRWGEGRGGKTPSSCPPPPRSATVERWASSPHASSLGHPDEGSPPDRAVRRTGSGSRPTPLIRESIDGPAS